MGPGFVKDMGFDFAKATKEALVDVDISPIIKTRVEDALAHNDIKAFETLMTKLLSDNTIDLEVRNTLKKTLKLDLENFLNGSKIEILNAGGPVAVGGIICLTAVALAAIFKEDVPFSVSVVILIAIFACVLGFWAAAKIVDDLRNFQEKLSGQTIARGEVARVNIKEYGKFHTELAAIADCGADTVSRDIVKGTVTLEAMSCLSYVGEYCGKVLAALQGRIDDGCSFTGLAENKEAAQQKVKREMNEMSTSITELKADLQSKTNAIAQTASYAQDLSSKLQALKKTLQRKMDRLPKRPDFLLSVQEKQKRDDVLDGIETEVKSLCTSFKHQAAKCKHYGSLDELQIRERCGDMIRALACAPEIEESAQKAIQNAIEAQKILNDKLLDESKKRSVAVSELLLLAQEKRIAQDTYTLRLAQLEGSMEKQKKIAKGLGQGSIRMEGYPPRGNTEAQRIYKNFMEGRWSQLPPSCFKVGSFKFTIDSHLSPAQQEARELLDKYVADIDELKEKHSVKMNALVEREKIIKDSLPILDEAIKYASEAADKGKAAQEKSWSSFKVSNPVEYSQINMLYDINNYVSKAAQWSFNPSDALSQVRCFMDELEASDDFHPRNLLPIVEELAVQLNDGSQSWPAFLKDVGEFNLKRMLKPMACGAEGFSQKFFEFNESEKKTIADAREVD